MNHEKLWNKFMGSRRQALLLCALSGRYYTKVEMTICQWTELPETVRAYLQEVDWEFALGKCRFELEKV